jgi:hypothetical protein
MPKTTQGQGERMTPLETELLRVLESIQFGFMHRRCPACAGWNMGPNGETDRVHTKDCPVGNVIAKAKGKANV